METIFRSGLMNGHVAIVTGGGSGIGLAIAKSLTALGAKVAICGRKPERLEAAKKELPDVLAAPCDIREPDQIAKFVDWVGEQIGPATVLVNNAGGQFPTPPEMLSPKGWEAVVRNNLNGTFFITQAVATKHMIGRQAVAGKRGGRIVNIIANIERGFPGMVHTGAARAGVENMTKTLAIEWAQHGIQVNCIAPGIIKSSGTDQYPPELVEASRQRTPAKRFGSVDEVAQLTVYLCCDASNFVTGETWYIDGGAHLWGDNWPIPDRA